MGRGRSLRKRYSKTRRSNRQVSDEESKPSPSKKKKTESSASNKLTVGVDVSGLPVVGQKLCTAVLSVVCCCCQVKEAKTDSHIEEEDDELLTQLKDKDHDNDASKAQASELRKLLDKKDDKEIAEKEDSESEQSDVEETDDVNDLATQIKLLLDELQKDPQCTSFSSMIEHPLAKRIGKAITDKNTAIDSCKAWIGERLVQTTMGEFSAHLHEHAVRQILEENPALLTLAREYEATHNVKLDRLPTLRKLQDFERRRSQATGLLSFFQPLMKLCKAIATDRNDTHHKVYGGKVLKQATAGAKGKVRDTAATQFPHSSTKRMEFIADVNNGLIPKALEDMKARETHASILD